MTTLDNIGFTGLSSFVGTTSEVCDWLSLRKGQQVITFTLPPASKQHQDALAKALETLASHVVRRMIEHPLETQEALANALMPLVVSLAKSIPPTQSLR